MCEDPADRAVAPAVVASAGVEESKYVLYAGAGDVSVFGA